MINLKNFIKKKNNTLLFVILFLLCAFIIGFVGGVFAHNLFDSDDGGGNLISEDGIKLQSADTNAMSTSQIVALVENSVVEVETIINSSEDVKTGVTSIGAGSGVVLTENGYIVTNAHVVEDAKSIKVKLHNESEYAAQLIGKDEKEDIAVLKIGTTGLSPVTFRNPNDTKVGERVIVIGNPLGTLGGSVTDGIISAVDRTLNIDGKEMKLIQTNAEINHGNSGGGMFGEDGQFVGLIVAKSSGDDLEGLGFAIPSDTVEKVVNKLM